jgi:hypothetical protein
VSREPALPGALRALRARHHIGAQGLGAHRAAWVGGGAMGTHWVRRGGETPHPGLYAALITQPGPGLCDRSQRAAQELRA